MKSTAGSSLTPGRDPLDEAIEQDVLELRRLTNGLPGPEEPHPAYWQNFVVKVHGRIDERRLSERARRFWWRWSAVGASVGAAAIVVFVGFKGVLPDSGSEVRNNPPVATTQPANIRSIPADPLFAADAKPLVMSREDVQKYNAIVTGDDDDVFEELVKGDQ